ncbi:MAG: 2Fe-2S iron-sulfur cluster-binding protein [Candidatus Poribacteria bacterium]
MPKCVIDGREVEFKPGENLIEVAKRVGVKIPYFCYHPGLSVVGQCRMCAVEIEKMPKLQAACSTPATDGMIVKTQSERAKKNQKSVMEFLLINHPLDCPICDKSGECDLQDFSYTYGDAYSRYTEERRTYADLDMGPVIKKNMNRCIHCTRCIRFGDEIAGIREMVATRRGNNTEISTMNGIPLETEYAGNYSDICPTGSLTLKDFRFKKRAWFLKKTATICEGCSRGCNMEIQQDGNIIYRCIARENLEINKYWLCDEGRFNFQYVNDEKRICNPQVHKGEGLSASRWEESLGIAKNAVTGKKPLVLIGSDMTLEETAEILNFLKQNFKDTTTFHFGTPGIYSSTNDGYEDEILKMKSKTSNLCGLEKMGLKGFEHTPVGVDTAVIFRGGRAVLPNLKGIKTIIGIGVFLQQQAKDFRVILPGLSFAEKKGTIINFEGREQKISPAIKPVGQSMAVEDVLSLWQAGELKATTESNTGKKEKVLEL